MTTTRPLTLLLPVLLLAAWLAPAGAARAEDDGVEIRPDWRQGQAARYEVWSLRQRTQEVSFGGDRQSFEVIMETTAEVSWQVDRVRDDGSAAVTMTYDWIRAEVTMPDGEQMVMDSRQRGDEHAMLRAIAGTPLDVAVEPDGSIGSVDGVDAIRRQADEPAAVPSDEDFHYTASHMATIAASPARLGPGEQWSARLTSGHDAGRMHYDLTYRLAEVGQIAGVGVATVVSEGRLDLEVEMPEGMPPVDVRLRDASYRGQVMMDLTRREVVGRNVVETSSIELTMDLGGQRATQTMTEHHQSQALRISEE